ncbi:MAG: prepilin-type N-terminal cleavage/methylation domain-containing protein [Candidatus Hydrogenedentes bacterium]|nr:prepilin-type N-terminal cleavage/methylation domain-containing protein [Candidatus Hydrogenedentota bacterium]
MNTRRHTRNCSGYSLLELLVVVVALGMLLNVLMLMFTSASRLAAYDSQRLNRLSTTAELGDEFVEIVRKAGGFAEAAGSFRADGDTLVLRMPAAAGTERFSVLDFRADLQRLSRYDLNINDGAPEISYHRTYSMPLARIAFHTDKRQVTLEATLPKNLRRQGEAAIYFTAAPRAVLEGQP